jgi:hypothetical protein
MSNLDQRTVSDVLTLVPGVARTLREYRIDPSNRVLFAHAAAAASTTVEEVLAVAEMRQRRAAAVLRERAVHELV